MSGLGGTFGPGRLYEIALDGTSCALTPDLAGEEAAGVGTVTVLTPGP